MFIEGIKVEGGIGGKTGIKGSGGSGGDGGRGGDSHTWTETYTTS